MSAALQLVKDGWDDEINVDFDSVPDDEPSDLSSEWKIGEKFLARGDHAELADLLLTVLRQRYADVAYTDGALHGYRDGVFEKILASELRWIVKRFAGRVFLDGKGDQPMPIDINSGTLSGTIALTHAETGEDDFFAEAPAGIAFSDGFVRVTPQGLQLVPHSPVHRARFRYEFPFREHREPSKFLAYLDAVFRDDADKGDKIAALQEFMGAAITGVACLHERALVLFGPGENGKTRLTEIIEATMPPGSSTAFPPSLWNDQFSRSLLTRARLNVVPDLTADALGPATKGIISGEAQQCRIPKSEAISFRPTAAHLFGCNKLPTTTDVSNGFFRRWLLLTMNRSFKNDPDRDPLIHKKVIASDLPAIVRWALVGAARLMSAKLYTLPPSHELMIERWRGEVDSTRLFIETRTRRAQLGEKGMLASVLHEAYELWCAGRETVPVGAKTFGQELAGLGVPGKRSAAGNLWGVVALE